MASTWGFCRGDLEVTLVVFVIYIYIWRSPYIYIYVYIYVYMYVHIHTHKHISRRPPKSRETPDQYSVEETGPGRVVYNPT